MRPAQERVRRAPPGLIETFFDRRRTSGDRKWLVVEKMLRAHTGTKPETPIDGVRQNWAVAPATGRPPSSSHASVAHAAARPSSQGPAPALRFNCFLQLQYNLCNCGRYMYWSGMPGSQDANSPAKLWR